MRYRRVATEVHIGGGAAGKAGLTTSPESSGRDQHLHHVITNSYRRSQRFVVVEGKRYEHNQVGFGSEGSLT